MVTDWEIRSKEAEIRATAELAKAINLLAQETKRQNDLSVRELALAEAEHEIEYHGAPNQELRCSAHPQRPVYVEVDEE